MGGGVAMMCVDWTTTMQKRRDNGKRTFDQSKSITAQPTVVDGSVKPELLQGIMMVD
jgi:hypothetical protein